MKVRMITTSAGPDRVIMAGQIIDVSPINGRELIKGGYAQLVEEPKIPKLKIPKETTSLKDAQETTEADSAKAETKERAKPDKKSESDKKDVKTK